MSVVSVPVPEETLVALSLTPNQMADEMRLATAMRMYELGRVSTGAAAELAGIPVPLFLTKLADYGIAAFRQTREELEEELANA